MNKAVRKGDKIEIVFDFDWRTLETVKSIPGRQFHDDEGRKYWTCPLSIEAIDTLLEAGFKPDVGLQEFLENSQIRIEDLQELDAPGLRKNLYPFQKKGLAFIEQRCGRALVGDEMGLGKTIQALAYLHLHPDKRPAVIVCPAHLKLNWEKEARETLPDNPRIRVLSGTTPDKDLRHEVIVVNYDILSHWIDEILKVGPQVVIIDEAHFCKNSKAKRTKATKRLARRCPHVIALTGTPIVNRPIEGYNVLRMVDKTLFPDFWEYANAYCEPRYTRFGWNLNGASNKEELHEKLKSVMIRRRKKDVLHDLPDKVFTVVPVEIDNRREYDKAEQDFIEYLARTKGRKAVEKAQRAEHLVRVEELKQLALKGKMKQAIQWIQEFIDSGNNGNSKLVVFTTHKKTVDDLMAAFPKIAVRVDGSVNAVKRQEAVTRFQTDESTKLFVGNVQAAGTGLTLTAASSVLFVELPWVAGELSQAEDRCHRIGQKNAVNIYYLLADGTIERKIAKLLDEKKKVLEAVLDGREVEDTQLLTELVDSYRGGEK